MIKIDHDRLFKEVLTTFFVEFIELFFPDVRRHLNVKSIQFMDKEIFTDITSGEKREADLIVKCRFLGRESFFLIHTEHQSKREKDFCAKNVLLLCAAYREIRFACLFNRAVLLRQAA